MIKHKKFGRASRSPKIVQTRVVAFPSLSWMKIGHLKIKVYKIEAATLHNKERQHLHEFHMSFKT